MRWVSSRFFTAPPRFCAASTSSAASLSVMFFSGRWREACAGLPLEHMGRGPDDDPLFFESAFAAGALARRLTG